MTQLGHMHPCAAQELLVDPHPEGASPEGYSTPIEHISRTSRKCVICCTRCSDLLLRRVCVFASVLSLVVDDYMRLVGVPARLEGKGPRLVP
jgi:hypothetical protein